MSEPLRYVLWGSAGHAKVLAGLIGLHGDRVVALFDNDASTQPALPQVPLQIGEPAFILWMQGQADRAGLRGLAAIGGSRGRDRLAVHRLFRAHGVPVHPLVHPRASVCATALIGSGTQVLAQAVVAADARLGEACIVNHGGNVDHECTLGDGVHVAPGATLCGCVSVGDNVLIGAGAVVLPRLRIGADSIVGAGAVVTRDLPPGIVAAGNPARILRNL